MEKTKCMKKSKKVTVKISNFKGVSEVQMGKVLGGSTNYDISKSNTGNVSAPSNPTTGSTKG